MPVTCLRKACVRPPEVAKIKIKIKIKINSRVDLNTRQDLDALALALALALASAFDFASKRAIAQAPRIATSGGRAQGLRREVTGMDARQALGPRMGPAARSSREQARSEGTPERSAGAG